MALTRRALAAAERPASAVESSRSVAVATGGRGDERAGSGCATGRPRRAQEAHVHARRWLHTTTDTRSRYSVLARHDHLAHPPCARMCDGAAHTHARERDRGGLPRAKDHVQIAR
jgi:hypothetical protein